MSDIFGKVVAILLCAWLMFLSPLQQMKEENRKLENMYIYQESVRFLDAVRNTGKISSEAWSAYQKKIGNMSGLYKISFSHERVSYGQNEGTEDLEAEPVYDYFYNEQIMEYLSGQKEYLLGYNDFIKVVVEDSDNHMVVCYGGSVKTGGEHETN